MAQDLLVETDRATMATLVNAADEQALDLHLVLIAKFEDYYTSRLVVASPTFAQHRELKNYKTLDSIVRQYGLFGEVPSPLVLRMDDPFVIEIQQRFGPVESTRGLAFASQTFGDRFVEDGVIFRIR